MMKTHSFFISLILSLSLFCSFASSSTAASLVKLQNYSGAICLDGTPGAYYFRKGSTDKYIIFMEGGGFCATPEECYGRSSTSLGSSKDYPATSDLGGGIMDASKPENPFATWNIAFAKYCDGSRWSGDAVQPVVYNKKNLHIRAKTIVSAIVKDLLDHKGMSKATGVVLGGCSAGGEGTYYLLDIVRELIPKSIDLKGFADAGWFLYSNNVAGVYSPYTKSLSGAYTMWNSSATLKKECLNTYKDDQKWMCLYAEWLYPYITTPLFLYNSQIDVLQLSSIYQLHCDGTLSKCNSTEKRELTNWVSAYDKSIKQVVDSKKDAVFVVSCNVHCQSQDNSWFGTKIRSVTPAKAFSDWYNKGALSKYVDECDYGCNVC